MRNSAAKVTHLDCKPPCAAGGSFSNGSSSVDSARARGQPARHSWGVGPITSLIGVNLAEHRQH